MVKWIVTALLPVFATQAFAQTDIASGCVDVYRVSTANLSYEQQRSAQYEKLRTEMCDGSNVKNDFNFTSKVDILFEGIPLGSDTGVTDKYQKAKLFCSSYGSLTQSFFAVDSFSREVVTSALGNFNACMELAEHQVTIRPTVVSASAATIRVDKTDSDPITLTSINSSPNLVCVSPQMGGQPLKYGQQYVSATSFTIDCRRHGEIVDGKFIFDTDYLTITLARSKYPFRLFLQPDAALSPQLSSEAAAEIEARDKAIAVLKQDLSNSTALAGALQSRLDTVRAYAITVYRGDKPPLGNSEGFHAMGCTYDWGDKAVPEAKWDPWTKAPCQKGYDLVKMKPFHISSGGCVGHIWRQFICIKK
ncbi:hypothetical protein NL532_16005 [Mesorhizobium sp. C120A]|uniref:hypothetical protein n=1 Tax=unclassified Mesorhizobium TaxID=325217 RepID=UPI0003CFB836|nr:MULTISPECIES: hypothetical protein [unclassified Mesorhizobium]ESZ62452.1 hypothetical protein X728_11410 [Mesorhizobium sp. L103C120A0]WJI42204.1 hypothetical protein NL532_16005 [Mesorhizobium sp. C120A]